ncbi:MAG: NAD(P)/FAD-dependent oxidoreductase [Verrucomicrobiota bacterium]
MADKAISVAIVGAGPAGLVCATELLKQNKSAAVTIVEKDPHYVGGIARTVEYKGFRFDIGGHRFFSKSREITDWWKNRLPNDFIQVGRLSRIFYRGVFFDYPLKAMNALFGLGIWTSTLCVLSYLNSQIAPIKPEKSFQDWVSNRFGRKLFGIFFKTYTEKVWGTPCDQISADWAAQRIKGLSLFKAIYYALLPQRPQKSGGEVVKTLIDKFEYPRLGPGQMWEKTRDDIVCAGGTIHMGESVVKISREGNRITSITTRNAAGGERTVAADQFIMTMPLRETILAIDPPLPEPVLEAARHLEYRDFLTVALMVKRTNLFPDNWIYVHDPSVHLGRIQNFNNWSSALVPAEGVTCLGLEYFCFEADELWNMPDSDLVELGKKELVQLGLVQAGEIFDGCVVRMAKAYPVYGPEYQKDVAVIREQIGKLENLQAVGRNGMHKYNNMDHSMMAALLASRRLFGSNLDPWNVNTDAEYHEESANHGN